MKNFRKNAKAISPVIATIIIVAVTIVMSIAVAYWMLGLAGTFTRYEKIEFVAAYAKKETTPPNNFNVTLMIKNTGTSDATLTTLFINGIPAEKAKDITISGKTVKPTWDKIDTTIPSGGNVTISFDLPSNDYTSGMSVEVMLQTAAGNQYPKTIVLP